MDKKGHLNWFFWLMVCIFLAVILQEVVGSDTSFQVFSKSVIKINFPYIHKVTAAGFGCVILLIAYLIATLFAGIINDIFNEGRSIAGFMLHDNSKILKNITEGSSEPVKEEL